MDVRRSNSRHNFKLVWVFSNLFLGKPFFPDSGSILHKRKRLTYDVIQAFFQELFTTNTEQNERIIRDYVEQKTNITPQK